MCKSLENERMEISNCLFENYVLIKNVNVKSSRTGMMEWDVELLFDASVVNGFVNVDWIFKEKFIFFAKFIQ